MTKTVTIQIGNSDDKLTQREWADFVEEVDSEIKAYAKDVHFFGGSSNWEEWQNVAWVITVGELADQENRLRGALRSIRRTWKQDSLAWTEGQTEFI